jgi:pimeloyl-ACP methyl ester carboxylesterase
MALPTFGGKQIWADVFLYGECRIQRNVYTGHHRLLGPADIRLAWGSFEHCYGVFHRQKARQQLALRSDHLVLLLHGIFRSKDSFGPMTRALRRAGYEAQSVNYPSTRRSLEDHADQVQDILDRALDVKRVSFVTHSMGGIVARVLLGRNAAWRKRIKINRLVMLGTPNRGAQFVRAVDQRVPAFHHVAGPSFGQMLPEKAVSIPEPDVPFGVVAGARGDGKGYNPLLTGDDDFTVSVQSALLDGAEDSLVVQAMHTFIMVKPEVIQATLRYLDTGAFREAPAHGD